MTTTTRVLRPRALRPGDTIAVVAPAGPAHPERLADGVALLRAWGFTVRLMPSTSVSRGFLAGESDEAKAAELSACFADPAIAGIMCARGGYGSMRLLPFIDWEAIRAHPKLFCGYSDITALHLAMRRETGLVTFHGPIAERQGDDPEGPHPWTAAGLRRALTSTTALGTITPPPDAPPLTVIRDGTAHGPLVGGNLTLVAALAGTRWQLDARGCILLLEDTNEAPYRVDRMLTQLHYAGIFDGVQGIVFGDSPTCDVPADEPRNFPLATVLADRLGHLGVPVVYGFPCGHTRFRATLPLGLPVTLDADTGTLTILEPACMGE